jgi:hypothetical protein
LLTELYSLSVTFCMITHLTPARKEPVTPGREGAWAVFDSLSIYQELVKPISRILTENNTNTSPLFINRTINNAKLESIAIKGFQKLSSCPMVQLLRRV